MPGGRRGLVAPQNTFLENIIRRSNSQRKYFFFISLSVRSLLLLFYLKRFKYRLETHFVFFWIKSFLKIIVFCSTPPSWLFIHWYLLFFFPISYLNHFFNTILSELLYTKLHWGYSEYWCISNFVLITVFFLHI